MTVALPTIGRALDASSTSLEWIVDAYAIVDASLLIAGGVLSDRQGRKGMFMIGVTVFGLGSLVSGVVPTVGWPTGVFLIPRIPRNRGVAPAPLIDVTHNSMRQIGRPLGSRCSDRWSMPGSRAAPAAVSVRPSPPKRRRSSMDCTMRCWYPTDAC